MWGVLFVTNPIGNACLSLFFYLGIGNFGKGNFVLSTAVSSYEECLKSIAV